MTNLNTTMDIFQLLDKSNCKKCNKPTCLAFAAAVFNGQKDLSECPQLSSDIIETYGKKTPADKQTPDLGRQNA